MRFHGKKHPGKLREEAVEKFLNYLAEDRKVAGSTQNQAFNALIFLYREVLEIELTGLNAKRVKKKKKLPVVLSREEIRCLFEHSKPGHPSLILQLIYGSGLRVSEDGIGA